MIDISHKLFQHLMKRNAFPLFYNCFILVLMEIIGSLLNEGQEIAVIIINLLNL